MSNEWLGPVAEVKCGRLQWAIPRDDYKLPTRFLNNDTHPLYDQAALDAAVAAERERWIARIEEAFKEGFYAPRTYNDTVLNTAGDEWEEAKAGLLRA